MNCRQARRNLDLYLDGRLSPKQCWALEAHLSHCPRCHRDLLNLHQVSRNLEGLKVSPAPGTLLPRVAALVASHQSCWRRPRRIWRKAAWWTMGLLGIAVSLAVGGAPQALSALEATLSSSALTLSQEPDLSFGTVSSLLETSLDGLATMVDHLLPGITEPDIGLLAGGCLLLLSAGALLFWALSSAPDIPSIPEGGI